MKQHENREEPRLPREWLPPALPPADAASWATQRAQIMARVDPVLRNIPANDQPGWATTLGAWWKPAAALAAAATLLVAVADMPGTPAQAALPLSVVAAQGDPVALWAGIGADADPVLALIVAQTAADAR